MDWNDYLAKRNRRQKDNPKYRKIYEAWQQYYPSLTCDQIAGKININQRIVAQFVVQINAAEGDYEKALYRQRAFSRRGNLRIAIRANPDHPHITEMIAEEARLDSEIKNLKTGGYRLSMLTQDAEITPAERQSEAEWLASGIDG